MSSRNASSWRPGLRLLACAAIAASPAVARGQAPGPTGETALVEAFLQEVKGGLKSPAALEDHRAAARVLARSLEARAVEMSADPAERAEIYARARRALIAGLSRELGGDAKAAAAAQAFVERAAKELRDSRTDYLERAMICWCPKEDWTKTLAGCPDNCADEQKLLLRQWLDGGATNEEIIDRMVAFPGKGSPQVRARPQAEGVNWVGYLMPGILGVCGLAVVIAALARLTRRDSREQAAGVSAPRADGGGGVAGDDAIAERIERELKEMDNS